MVRGSVTLAVNGEKLRVPDIYDPSNRLIDVLRSETRFTGPKVGCGEGGCGACTVLVDRFNPVTGAVSRCSINACLAPIGACDGAAITTVEGLGSSKAGFHPAQEALAKRFGSQCGYCTPGVVVALAAAAEQAAATAAVVDSCESADSARAVAIARGLDGNLCRCTGWRPIIDAARDIAELEDLDKQPACCKHSCLRSSSNSSTRKLLPPPAAASFPAWLKQYVARRQYNNQVELQQHVMQYSFRHCDFTYRDPRNADSAITSAAAAAAAAAPGAAATDPEGCDGQKWLKPGTLGELTALLRQHCSCKRVRLVSGNTAAGVFKDLWPHDRLVVDLGGVQELHQVDFHRDGVMLGAGVTIQKLIRVLRSPSSSSSSSSVHGSCNRSSIKPCRKDGSCSRSRDFPEDRSHGSSSTQAAMGHEHAAAAASAAAVHPEFHAAAPTTTKVAWGAMADHLERIAGVQVRSAATLGGHFGVLAAKPLPTDLALVLAAAGAWLQVLHIKPQATAAQENSTAAAAAAAAGYGGGGGLGGGVRSEGFSWQQQQQQQHDLTWVTVQDYLDSSCVGNSSVSVSGSSSDSSSSSGYITADTVAGAKVINQDHYHQQQQQYALNPNIVCGDNATPATATTTTTTIAAAAADAGYRVITAVWLPYSNDACELFWSYKVSLRHVNSHALVNAALLIKFDQSAFGRNNTNHQQGSSSSSSGAGDVCTGNHSSISSSSSDMRPLSHTPGSSPFAGAAVAAARLFLGFSPSPPASSALQGAAAVGPASSAAVCANPAPAEYKWQEGHWRVLRVAGFEELLQGKTLDVQGVIRALRQLETQLSAAGLNPDAYHAQTLQGILLKALVPLLDPNTLPPARPATAATPAAAAAAAPQLLRLLRLPEPYNPKALPQGRQVLPGEDERSVVAASAPVHLPIEKDAVRLQASGEAVYAADVAAAMSGRLLYLGCVKSTRALAAVLQLDAAAAVALPGVVGIITAADVIGRNEVFGAPLLADGKVEYVGQPIALIAATSQAAADCAAALVKVEYSPIPGQTPIITIDQAVAAGAFYDNCILKASAVRSNMLKFDPSPSAATDGSPAAPSKTTSSAADGTNSSMLQDRMDASSSSSSVSDLSQSNVDNMVDQLIATAPRKITGGCYSLPAQQHMYMETQVAVAAPAEDGCVKVTSATQSLDAVQQAVAAVLGVPFNKVAVVTKRVGGGFGGKASRSMPVAAAAALAATLFGAPVCYSVNRNDDFAQNGGRCSGRLTYDVGFWEDGKVVAIKAEVLLRAGAYFDLASNDGAQLLAASDSAYNLSGLHVSVKYARCNLAPHTIMRGPGYLQGVMVLEQILEHVAAELGMDAAAVKAANFLAHIPASPAGSGQQLPLLAPVVGSICAAGAEVAAGASAGASAVHVTSSSDGQPVHLSSTGRLCVGSAATLPQHLQQQHQEPGEAGPTTDSLTMVGSSLSAGSSSISSTPKAAAAAVAERTASGVTTLLGRFIAADTYTLPRLWGELLEVGRYKAKLAAVQQYNRDYAWSKRGIAVTPVRFDCAPAAVSAALSVYADGSVLVTHGGIEMGQGLSTKVKQAAVAALSQLLPEEQRPLPLNLVRLAPSSSAVVPNGGPTWSSTGSEGNCQAVMNAAAKVVAQMTPYAKVGADGLSTWQATLAAMFPDVGFAAASAMLSAYGYFDGSTGSGSAKQAVQYSAFGAAMTEVELDVCTGERKVLSSHIMYDCGYSLNPGIDLGQVEGAFVMGLGVMLCEDVIVDDITGEVLTASTWNYKIPTPDLIPQKFTVQFLAKAPNPRGILSSKASGEPALMTSTSALMALQQAAAAALQELHSLAGGVNAAATAADSSNTLCGVDASAAGKECRWCVLPAPATPQKLKGVLGSFCIADALQAALVSSTLATVVQL